MAPTSGRNRKRRRTRSNASIFEGKSPVKAPPPARLERESALLRNSSTDIFEPDKSISEEPCMDQNGEEFMDMLAAGEETPGSTDCFSDEDVEELDTDPCGIIASQQARQLRQGGVEETGGLTTEDAIVEEEKTTTITTPPPSPARLSDQVGTPMSITSSTVESRSDEPEGTKTMDPSAKKKKTQRRFKVPDALHVVSKRFLLVVDIEITGSMKTWDQIIQLGAVITEVGSEVVLATFGSKIKVDVEVQPAAFNVHGISKEGVENEPSSREVFTAFIEFVNKHTTLNDVVVVVAHNGNVCDFPMIMIELERLELSFPTQVKYFLDSLEVIRNKNYNSHWSWKDATRDQWTILTATGEKSHCLQAMVNWKLSEGGKKKSRCFESVIGDEHDAIADARGLAEILMPGDFGIYQVITKYKVLTPVEHFRQKAIEALEKPVIKHFDPPPGWTEPHGGNPPAGEVPFPMFPRGAAARAGQPTEALIQHIKNQTDGDIPTNEEDLLYAIFTFFFTFALLVHIVNCTNAYAKIHCPAGWYELTVHELYVHLGIRFLMGMHKRARESHYWSRGCVPGLRLGAIADVCTFKRHRHVIAMLTFYWPEQGCCCDNCPVCQSTTGYDIDNDDPYAKLRKVDTYLQERAQLALYPEQIFVVDETMVKVLSRYCSFGQVMKNKPIKYGIKFWCLVFSLSCYLYSWRPYLGKRDPIGRMAKVLGKGYVHCLIYDHLIPVAWHHTNCVLICDNYFTSIVLFSALLAVGIYAIGVSKAKKPAKSPKEAGTSWPIQEYGKKHERFLPRGWMRVMYRVMDDGTGTMMALTWRDNRFVQLLATCCIVCAAALTVQRWCKVAYAYVTIPVCLAMVTYQKYMNGVDRMDAVAALANIRMNKCPRRFHRQIFFYFLLSNLGHGNVKILFEKLFEGLEELKKKHESSGVGYFWWFQNQLAHTLIHRGLEGGRKAALAALHKQLPEAVSARAQRLSISSPYSKARFEPQRGRKPTTESAFGIISGKHELVSIKGHPWQCEVCKAWGLGRKDAYKMCSTCKAPLCKEHQCKDERFGTDDDPFWNHAVRQARSETCKLVKIKSRKCHVCKAWSVKKIKYATLMCKTCNAPLCKEHQCRDARFGTKNDPFWNHELKKAQAK